MNYNDEIIRFFTTALYGWDVTGYHSRSLFIIKNRHNFGHNLQVNCINSSFEFLSLILNITQVLVVMYTFWGSLK